MQIRLFSFIPVKSFFGPSTNWSEADRYFNTNLFLAPYLGFINRYGLKWCLFTPEKIKILQTSYRIPAKIFYKEVSLPPKSCFLSPLSFSPLTAWLSNNLYAEWKISKFLFAWKCLRPDNICTCGRASHVLSGAHWNGFSSTWRRAGSAWL